MFIRAKISKFNYYLFYHLFSKFFIQNLCNNDFPEQLAKSINQIKTKKIAKVPEQKPCTSKQALDETKVSESTGSTKIKSFSLEKKLAAFKPKIVPKNKPEATDSKPEAIVSEGAVDNSENNLASILNIRTDVLQRNDSNSFDPFSPFQSQHQIGNDEISYLADYFSEPAFATLYEAISK